MKLVKCVIPNSAYNFQVYCKMGEKVDDKSSVLLGFKDCLPVITNCETNCKQDHEKNSKKIVKVQVDPSTGEKFINLNGKKLKMIPESQIKTKLNLTNQKNLCIKPTSFRVLTKIPFNLKAVQKVQNKVEAHLNLMKLQSDDNSFSVLRKTNFISQENPNIDKDNRHTFGNNLINKITTDNEKCDEFITDNASVDRVKCSTQLPKIVDMKIKKDEKDVHMLQLDNNERLQKNVTLKNVETQTPESSFKNTVNSLDLDIDLDDLNLFEPSIFSAVDPTWVNPPTEQPTSNNLAEKFFEALRKALVPDHEGNMPIHVGVITKNCSLVRRSCFLLQILEQEVDFKNNNNLTPLQLAVMFDSDLNIVECLLSNRASIEITDSEGNNVIHLAVQYERGNLLPVLLSYCRSSVLNQYNHEGMTPLLICSMKSLKDCTQLLLAKGADVNARDQISGRTPLFHAAERKDKEMVKLLLTHNADTKIKNFFGTSAHDAMYEIEELPVEIKNLILGKALKRKNTEDTRGMAKLKKHQVCLKTYARYEKVSDMTIKHFQKL